MAEDGSVFLDALVDSGDEAHLIVRRAVAGGIEMDSPLAPQVLVDGLDRLSGMLALGKAAAYCP